MITPPAPLVVAEAAARAAGARLRIAFGAPHQITHKSAIDLVTEMDREAETLIVESIRRSFPDHAILAEESGSLGTSEHLWMVDPLDGTTNYAHGHPQFCVSIGYAHQGVVEAGVVYDPLRDEMFAAQKGCGASLNGRLIRVSAARALGNAMLATGFPYDRRERADFYMPFYRAAVVASQGVRRAGAAALDVAWVACGRLDAYFEFGIKPWDVAAGELLVREAGGTVTDMKGGTHRLDGANTLATNGLLHRAALDLIAGAWR